MGNQDAGGALQDQIERLLDLPLCERVDAGSGFIQYKNTRIVNEHPHQGYQLALPH